MVSSARPPGPDRKSRHRESGSRIAGVRQFRFGDNDLFGTALAAGRFHPATFGDEKSESLAVGAPLEKIGSIAAAGAVNVIHGGPNGLCPEGNQFLHDGVLPGGTLQVFTFGTRLAALRFSDKPSAPDSLVIGAPFTSQNGVATAGAIWIVPGFDPLLDLAQAKRVALTPAYAAGPAMSGDAFGSAFAAADFNDDGFNDLAIGIPGHDVQGAANAGAVQVIYQSEHLFIDGFDQSTATARPGHPS